MLCDVVSLGGVSSIRVVRVVEVGVLSCGWSICDLAVWDFRWKR